MTENAEPRFLDRLIEKIRNSEALLLAMLPVTAYLVICVYYAGTFSVFGLPLELIDPGVAQVFIVAVIIATAGLVVFIARTQLQAVLLPFPIPLISALLNVFDESAIYVVVVLGILTGADRLSWGWLFGAGPILFVFMNLVLPVLTERSTPGYLARLERAEERSKRAFNDLSRGTTGSWLGRLVILVGPRALFVVLLLFAVHGLGRYLALTQREFYVIDQGPRSVILYIGQSRVVLGQFDSAAGTLHPIYEIRDINNLAGMHLTLERIGPLRLEASSPTLPRGANSLGTTAGPTEVVPFTTQAIPIPTQQPH